MRRIIGCSLVALVLLPAVAWAQEHMGEMEHDRGVGMVSIRPLYERYKGWVIASAEQMPEEHYAFQPTPEVRTFGQLIGHVANASYLFCSGALGEENPNSEDYEELTSRSELTEALKQAFAYCDGAYEMDEATSMQQTTFFGQEGSRLSVLNFNVAHDGQHYGNIVTYMRIKGLVPPSSGGGE